MKKIYITLGLLATMAMGAQTDKTKEADKLFAKLDYIEAAEAYQKLDGSPYVYKQTADSYYFIFNSKEAVKWYAKATETEQDAETYFRYAQMLKAEGRYEDANKQMKKFAAMAPKDQRAILFNQDPDYLPKLRSQPALFSEKVLDINDQKYGSFAPVLVDDNSFYFTSSRNTARKTAQTSEEPYLDIYTATYNANGSFSEPVPVSELNSKWHDGPVAVSSDGKTMYFNTESFNEDGKQWEKDKDNNLKVGQIFLYKSTKNGDKWGEPKLLSFNDKKWSTMYPSISKDGKWLYFASDREGSMNGSLDLWKVEIKSGGTYGEPQNLGPKINTEGKESYPFITDDNKLYFSSDRPKGFGGMDVFVVDLAKNGEVMNVGAPINSAKDDFSFSFNNTKNIGFFSSNRGGADKMYSATPICGVEAIVMVRDAKTGKALATAKVSILDDKGNIIETRNADGTGKVTYNVDCNKPYSIQASMAGYHNGVFPIDPASGGVVNISANLEPIVIDEPEPLIVIHDIYFEYDKSNITKEAAFDLDKIVTLMKKNPNIVIMARSHTDSRGTDAYNMSLSNRRAKSTVQYIISKGISADRISAQGYGEGDLVEKCGEDCTEEQHAKNRRSEFVIVKK